MIVDINQELGSGSSGGRSEGQVKTADETRGRQRVGRSAVIIEPQGPAWLSRLSTFLAR